MRVSVLMRNLDVLLSAKLLKMTVVASLDGPEELKKMIDPHMLKPCVTLIKKTSAFSFYL